jgi:F420-non-reducing hydrogenase iron-sulfur subunit
MTDDFKPKIIAFLCNWCSYGAADLAGVSRMEYPPDIRIIRLPCTGRMSPKFILEAFRHGCDGVWVSGCHPGDCHYIAGNLHARRKFALLNDFMKYAGLEDGRLHFSWISSAEGEKFARVATEVVGAVKKAGPGTGFAKNRTKVA